MAYGLWIKCSLSLSLRFATQSSATSVMNSNTVKVLTIHSAKGLEAKNVMVYGALYYSKSEVCTTYVAMTRAKDRLYMLTAPKRREISKSKTKTNVINWE